MNEAKLCAIGIALSAAFSSVAGEVCRETFDTSVVKSLADVSWNAFVTGSSEYEVIDSSDGQLVTGVADGGYAYYAPRLSSAFENSGSGLLWTEAPVSFDLFLLDHMAVTGECRRQCTGSGRVQVCHPIGAAVVCERGNLFRYGE